MTVEDLCDTCFNLFKESNVKVIEKSKKQVEQILASVYDEIRDRQVSWFYVEDDKTVIITLKERSDCI